MKGAGNLLYFNPFRIAINMGGANERLDRSESAVDARGDNRVPSDDSHHRGLLRGVQAGRRDVAQMSFDFAEEGE